MSFEWTFAALATFLFRSSVNANPKKGLKPPYSSSFFFFCLFFFSFFFLFCFFFCCFLFLSSFCLLHLHRHLPPPRLRSRRNAPPQELQLRFRRKLARTGELPGAQDSLRGSAASRQPSTWPPGKNWRAREGENGLPEKKRETLLPSKVFPKWKDFYMNHDFVDSFFLVSFFGNRSVHSTNTRIPT